MSSMAFWLALIIGGGPLGLSGAQAALLTEVRDSAAHGLRPGVFMRCLRTALRHWRGLLVPNLIVTACLVLLIILVISTGANLLSLVLGIFGGFWIFAIASQIALRQSLGLPVHIAFGEVMMSSYVHLLVFIWWLLVVLTYPYSLVPALLAVPRLTAISTAQLERPVLALISQIDAQCGSD